MVGLVPARAGSQRVPGKNTRLLGGLPLLVWSLASAVESGVFERIVVSTDSPETAELAKRHGADVPFLRPPELATTTSPDIEWMTHALEHLDESYDGFAILRPTSPFRSADLIRRAMDRFLELSASHDIDSIRAVELVKEHPGKMWVLDDDGDLMQPLLDQAHLAVPWHDGQYQALPRVHVQNSSLELAWTRCVFEQRLRGGRRIAPLLTDDVEGLTIDLPEDWERAERLVASGRVVIPAP